MIDPSFLKKKKPKWRYPIIAVLFHIFVVGVLILTEIYLRKEMLRTEIKKMMEVKTISNADLQRLLNRARVVDTEWAPPSEQSDKTPDKVYAGEKTQRVKTETQAKEAGTSKGSLKPGSKVSKEQSKNPFGRKLEAGEKSKFHKGNYDVLDPSIKVSDRTLLNTEAYIYATFTNRMKESIAAIWDPKARKVLTDKEKRIGIGVYVTVVRIFIAKDGTVERVVVEQSSGIPELDQAGVTSIWQVRAFPNPPPELFVAPSRGDFDFSFVASMVPGRFLRFNYVPDEKLDRAR